MHVGRGLAPEWLKSPLRDPWICWTCSPPPARSPLREGHQGSSYSGLPSGSGSPTKFTTIRRASSRSSTPAWRAGQRTVVSMGEGLPGLNAATLTWIKAATYKSG